MWRVLEPCYRVQRGRPHKACQETLAVTVHLQTGQQCAGSSFGSRIDAGDVWSLMNSGSLRRCGGTQLGMQVLSEIICGRNGELSPKDKMRQTSYLSEGMADCRRFMRQMEAS